jgi:Domain of unknown function (DUF4280)
MALQVCYGASLQCSFGTSSSSLVVEPVHHASASQNPAANVDDCQPLINIMPFALCTSLANPTVAAATAAAMGALTPMPCIPVTPSPWSPGSIKVQLGGAAALEASSTLTCNWGGVIQITAAGQTKASDT